MSEMIHSVLYYFTTIQKKKTIFRGDWKWGDWDRENCGWRPAQTKKKKVLQAKKLGIVLVLTCHTSCSGKQKIAGPWSRGQPGQTQETLSPKQLKQKGLRGMAEAVALRLARAWPWDQNPSTAKKKKKDLTWKQIRWWLCTIVNITNAKMGAGVVWVTQHGSPCEKKKKG
jgi:hypothetical protein